MDAYKIMPVGELEIAIAITIAIYNDYWFERDKDGKCLICSGESGMFSVWPEKKPDDSIIEYVPCPFDVPGGKVIFKCRHRKPMKKEIKHFIESLAYAIQPCIYDGIERAKTKYGRIRTVTTLGNAPSIDKFVNVALEDYRDFESIEHEGIKE